MAGHTDNEIFIAAPPGVVWAAANDLESWPELFAGEYAKVEVLERHPDRVRFRLTTEPEDGQVRSWVSERYLDEAGGTVTARRLERGPFNYMHIFQSFTATQGGTLLRWVQDFEARPEVGFTDEQAQARIDEHSRRNLRRHKQLIEERVADAPADGEAG